MGSRKDIPVGLTIDGIEIHCQYSELVDISELKPHPKNRNNHSEAQIDRLCEIIKYQGVRHPIKVSNLSGFISSGHGRLLAAKKLGMKRVPVSYQDYTDEAQEYADLIADNAIASWSELDLSGINSDIGDLGPDFEIDLLGIKDFVLEPTEKLDPQCDEDEVPEHVEPKAKLGDIYQLGRHRLMCGDSTSVDALEKLMNGQKADMVFTDPPYGMNLDTDYSKMAGKGNRYKKVIGDDTEFDPRFLLEFFRDVKEIFLWGADYYADKILKNGSWYVWDKRQSDRLDIPLSLDNVFGSSFELCWSKEKHRREIFRVVWTAGLGQGMDEERKGRNNTPNRVHPTQKPIDLILKFFDNFEENKVVDLYGGSGSTLIACEKTNRTCFMMELDPQYIDVIVARWEKYTGKKAELLNG